MRVSFKVLLTLLFAAVVPVAVSGFAAVSLARAAVADAAAAQGETDAQHLAEIVENTIVGSLDDLRQASELGLERLSSAELQGALWVIYRGDNARSIVALVDGDSGTAVVPPAYLQSSSVDAGLVGHDIVTREAMEQFAAHIPLREALAVGRAIGVPYADPVRKTPLIALAVRVPAPPDKDGKARAWVVAVELSLKALSERFREAREERRVALLADLEGRAVCHTDARIALSRADVHDNVGVAAANDLRNPTSRVVPQPSDAPNIVAYARATRLAGPDGRTWAVVVERDREDALAPVARLVEWSTALIGVALAFSLLAGAVLARGIARPVETLAEVMQRFAGVGDNKERDSGARAPPLGSDEIGALARTFNQMADEIEKATAELRGFNESLQKKVDDKTRELRLAQDHLVQSTRAAAAGDVSSGVAAALRMPLDRLKNALQMALVRSDRDDVRVRPSLVEIDKEATRMREIVDGLTGLGPAAAAVGVVDVNEAVEAALSQLAHPLIAQRIQVKKELQHPLPRVRGRMADVQQMVSEVLSNAKDAMPGGGTLTLRTEVLDGRLVRVVVDDTGVGMSDSVRERAFEPLFTTHAAQGKKGMGLAVVRRIIDEMDGRVTLESTLAKGTSVRIAMPVPST